MSLKPSSHYVSFLTNRRRRKSQLSSVDSLSTAEKPLLEKSPAMNNTIFPQMPTPSNSPPLPEPPSKDSVPSSPSMRKRVFANIGCSCSKEALDEELLDSPRPPSKDLSFNVFKDLRRQLSAASRAHPSSGGTERDHRPVSALSSISLESCSRQTSSMSEVPHYTSRDAPAPTLTLPDDTLNTGLGWGDEFGIRIRPPRPWLQTNRTVSQVSKQTTWSQPSRPPSPHIPAHAETVPRSKEVHLPYSSSVLAMPTPRTVLEMAGNGLHLDGTNSDTSSFFTPEEERSPKRKDVLTVRFLENFDDANPPRLGIQTGNSDEWAAAVLQAVGTAQEAS